MDYGYWIFVFGLILYGVGQTVWGMKYKKIIDFLISVLEMKGHNIRSVAKEATDKKVQDFLIKKDEGKDGK